MSESEHIFTHNAAGQTVTHAAFGATADRPAAPLCGWIAPGEAVTADWAQVTCEDCLAARD